MTKNENRGPTEHWTKMLRPTMEEPAWRALRSTSQALYPWLKFEWRGAQNNNNGKIRLSVRQAAAKMGIGRDAVAMAFHDLQAKGFLVVTEPARLGMSGEAKSPAYEITEIGLSHGEKKSGRKLYQEWRESHDFQVHKAMANNARGANGKTEPCHGKHDGTVIEIMTKRKTLS